MLEDGRMRRWKMRRMKLSVGRVQDGSELRGFALSRGLARGPRASSLRGRVVRRASLIDYAGSDDWHGSDTRHEISERRGNPKGLASSLVDDEAKKKRWN